MDEYPIQWQEIDGELEPGIAREVDVLRAAGCRTFSSCEGGEGHPFPEPTVRMWPRPRFFYSEDELLDVAQILGRAGYKDFYVKDCRWYGEGAIYGYRFIEVEFIRLANLG